jgi:hypothetical protein
MVAVINPVPAGNEALVSTGATLGHAARSGAASFVCLKGKIKRDNQLFVPLVASRCLNMLGPTEAYYIFVLPNSKKKRC